MVDTPMLGEGHSQRHLLSSSHIRLRMMLLGLVLVVLLTGLLLSLVGSVFSQLTPAIENDLRWKAQQGARELSQSADLGLLTVNVAILSKVTEANAREGDFLYLAFHDGKGQRVFERGDRSSAPAPIQEPAIVTEDERAFVAWAPLSVEGLFVGSVTLAVSKHRLAAGADLYRRIVAAGVVAAVAALGLALWFMRVYVTPILRLTERTLGELAQTAERALASARAKSQFLANMSHEIRTPMNGVFGVLHLLEQTELTATQGRYLTVMSASARSLLTIVNDVLDFSKLDAERYELMPVRCRLRDVVDQAAALFRVKAQEKGLVLHAQVDEAIPEQVLLDADRFRQIVSNLLSNAVKFTRQGSVELSLRVAEPADAEAARRAPRWLEVRVLDTGIGVPALARDQLFRAFSQVDPSPSRQHEGTGLGLAISRKLVELMGGRIEHEQPAAGGSTFWFVLPLEEAGADGDTPAELGSSRLPVAPASRAAGREPPRFDSERPVLLVDDNEVNLLVATEILEGLGLSVQVASGGREAIEVALAGDYALVLMDCQMPEVDGYQATAEIRRREQGKRLPIVAFTAHALAEERTKVLAAGMDDYVTKPIDPDELRRVLSRWLTSAPRGASALSTLSTLSKAPEPVPAAALARDDDALPDLEPGRRRPLRALTLFMEQTPRQIDELRAAADAERHGVLRDIAHLMKGSSGSLGATRLAALCERMQVSASDLPRERARALVEQIARAYDAAQATIASEIETERRAP